MRPFFMLASLLTKKKDNACCLTDHGTQYKKKLMPAENLNLEHSESAKRVQYFLTVSITVGALLSIYTSVEFQFLP